LNEEAAKSPAATNPDAVAAAPEPKPPRRLFSREWAALLFAVVIRDRADHRDDATLPLDPINQGSEEVKLVRELYRQFYLQEKSYLQIAGGIESCQKLYKKRRAQLPHRHEETCRHRRLHAGCPGRVRPGRRAASA
jgi:hypothetical protein